MASDRDTLAAVILGSGLNLDRGPYVETWPEDEREYHRRPDWPSFEHRAYAMQEYRREKLANDFLAAGVRPPAREITTAAEADALPVGSILRDRQGDAWRLLHRIGGTGRWLCTSLIEGQDADGLIIFGPSPSCTSPPRRPAVADTLHTVEIAGDPDNPQIKFTCHGDAAAPCHQYPDCECETWTASHAEEYGHPVAGHEKCWMQDWFDNDGIDPSTDILDEGDYRPGMSGPITTRSEVPDYIEWWFTAEEAKTDA